MIFRSLSIADRDSHCVYIVTRFGIKLLIIFALRVNLSEKNKEIAISQIFALPIEAKFLIFWICAYLLMCSLVSCLD